MNFKYSILVLLVVLPLYLSLIPNYNYIGASIAKTISFLSGAIFLLYNLTKIINIKLNVIKILIWLVFNLIIGVLLSRILYENILGIFNIFIAVVSLLYFKIFSLDELSLIFRMIGLENKMPNFLSRGETNEK
jgi:D-alanyl-lipoteichoic acid acyltransferase DltB (MBOAT superfamily)